MTAAAAAAAGVLATQLTFHTLSTSGEACAQATSAASGSVAGVSSALLSLAGLPAVGVCASSLALAAGAGLAHSISGGTLVLATGASCVAGLAACAAVTVSLHVGAHIGAVVLSAAARLRARQVGRGTWAVHALGRLQDDGLDALRWVELPQGGGEGREGREEAALRLYCMLSTRTTPRSSRCALDAYVEVVLEGCGADAPVVAQPPSAADAARRWLLVPLPPPPAYLPPPGP